MVLTKNKVLPTISTNNLSMNINRKDLVKIVEQIKKLIYPEAFSTCFFYKVAYSTFFLQIIESCGYGIFIKNKYISTN